MALYENVFIARQDITPGQVEALTEKYIKLIEDAKGKVEKREYWGLRNLAYVIQKNKKGHYTMLNYDAHSDVMKEVERQMGLDTDVIRFMTIRLEEIDQEPSIMMSSSRDDDKK